MRRILTSKRVWGVVALGFILAATFTPLVFAADSTSLNVKLPDAPASIPAKTPGVYLTALFQYGIGLAALIALAQLVLGAVQYTASAGAPSLREDAKGRMRGAIIGLILLLISATIMLTLNKGSTKLNQEDLNVIVARMERVRALVRELEKLNGQIGDLEADAIRWAEEKRTAELAEAEPKLDPLIGLMANDMLQSSDPKKIAEKITYWWSHYNDSANLAYVNAMTNEEKLAYLQKRWPGHEFKIGTYAVEGDTIYDNGRAFTNEFYTEAIAWDSYKASVMYMSTVIPPDDFYLAGSLSQAKYDPMFSDPRPLRALKAQQTALQAQVDAARNGNSATQSSEEASN